VLTHHELATIHAALTFWQEEMCPHGIDVMLPYFDLPGIQPLSAGAITQLRRRFKPDAVRYVIAAASGARLINTQLYVDTGDAIQAAGSGQVATVLLYQR
jgi:hypothetical protein